MYTFNNNKNDNDNDDDDDDDDDNNKKKKIRKSTKNWQERLKGSGNQGQKWCQW